jgi:hypothetical protein
MRMPISRAVSPTNCFARRQLSTEIHNPQQRCQREFARILNATRGQGAEITHHCALGRGSFC